METRKCQNCKNDFTITPDDFSFYTRMEVPPPTFCPDCRYKRRIIWRNVHNLFRGIDAITGKDIFIGIPPQSGIPIYELSYWNSDEWDPLDYGKVYDFEKPFFQQFRDLFYSVPFSAKSMQRCIDSDYSNQCDDMKNTYLCFNATFMEDSAYCCNGSVLKNCFDLTSCYNSESCYDNVRVDKSYHTLGSVTCENCVDVWFSKNCVGCTNCFGCVNLRNSTYKIFNQQYSKEEYFEKLKSMNLDTWTGFFDAREQAERFWKKFPIKYMLGFRNYNVTGEDIKDSKNVKNSYIVQKGEDLKYVQDVPFGGASNSYDYTSWGVSASQMYECLVCGEQVDKIRFSFDCYPSCQDLQYCINARRSRNCFGCVGVKDKQYCIFNTQYTKEEYMELVEKIKQQMNDLPYVDPKGHVYRYGEFFPIEISPFAYNETLLNDQFPSTKEAVEKEGFVWREQNRREYEATISAFDLPESINETDKEITKELIQCLGCKKAYRVIFDEFQFLKNSNIPLPRYCFDCRFARRQKYMVAPVLKQSQCMCNGQDSLNLQYENIQPHESHGHARCPNTFETAYDIDTETIYCEECYKKEVF